ncbi:hypothetical protein [Desulforegula conservatrix]|uniref:hypothetical protein n=1 Tax=Desulforegula conservatrix TaxID=153026 RepID=UPI0004815F55|nr:hypothetical protein [Desulforegula conservatrix]
METYRLTEDEIKFLGRKYPYLKYNKDINIIKGVIDFDLEFPSENSVRIKDKYSIEIDFSKVNDHTLPSIRETDGKISNIAERKKIPREDLHLNNKNGELCIIIPPKIKERYPNGFDLEEFLNHLEEHLYWVSYYDRYNKKPWPDYGHSELGYLQLYLENKILYSAAFKNEFGISSRPELRRKIKYLKRKYNL